ncbi:hypothetical protein [Flavobacterium sp.]|uniref:hypothetical protein n=1 Tax=Flavobacterium sp. TaxID=239 RepID=UPI0032676CDC
MEPNNFEKDFREKLNQRKIEPSDKAWDRLDAMLSVAENKKPKKNRKWLYIAASIVGFLLVGTFFFNQKKTVEFQKDSVVIEENIKKDSVIPELNTVDPVKTGIVTSEKNTTTLSNKESNNNQKPNKMLKNESNQIAESSIIIKNNQGNQLINKETVAAEIPKKESINQLPDTSEKTVIAENSVKPKSKVKINADDLLNQVDGELELSFREKVISKVNKNYQTVKVALANRNNQ